MTEQDRAIVAFIKANTRACAIAAASVLVAGFVMLHWDRHSSYDNYEACNYRPTSIGVIACHLS